MELYQTPEELSLFGDLLVGVQPILYDEKVDQVQEVAASPVAPVTPTSPTVIYNDVGVVHSRWLESNVDLLDVLTGEPDISLQPPELVSNYVDTEVTVSSEDVITTNCDVMVSLGMAGCTAELQNDVLLNGNDVIPNSDLLSTIEQLSEDCSAIESYSSAEQEGVDPALYEQLEEKMAPVTVADLQGMLLALSEEQKLPAYDVQPDMTEPVLTANITPDDMESLLSSSPPTSPEDHCAYTDAVNDFDLLDDSDLDPDYEPYSTFQEQQQAPAVVKSSYNSKRGERKSTTAQEKLFISRSHPYKKLTAVEKEKERKERKKEQNKQAALRYREKKRAEQNVVDDEADVLERRNQELRDTMDSMTREIQYLKDLMTEVYRARGVTLKRITVKRGRK